MSEWTPWIVVCSVILFDVFVLTTTIWVYRDARKRIARGERIEPAWVWLLGCLMMWLVFFPFYLYKRARGPEW